MEKGKREERREGERKAGGRQAKGGKKVEERGQVVVLAGSGPTW